MRDAPVVRGSVHARVVFLILAFLFAAFLSGSSIAPSEAKPKPDLEMATIAELQTATAAAFL